MVLFHFINYLINRYIPSNWLSCFNRKILPSFTAARARSSNRKQNFFQRLRYWGTFLGHWYNFFCRKSSEMLGFYLFLHISKLLWKEWVAYFFFSANFTLITEKWLWPLEYPFKKNKESACMVSLLIQPTSCYGNVWELMRFYQSIQCCALSL